MPNRNQRECYFAFGVEAEQLIDLSVDEPGHNPGRKMRGFGHRQKIGKDGAVIPSEVAIGAGAIFPGVAPVSASTNNYYRSVRNGWIAGRGFDQCLAEVAGSQLAQAELGDAEMVDASRKTGRIFDAGQSFTRQIGADDVEFDFVEGAGARGGAEKSFSLLVFLAPNDPRREEEELRQGLEIGHGLDGRLIRGRRDGVECGVTGLPEIPGETQDFERGINLEQEWLVFPVQEMGIHPDAELRMLGAAVILPGGVEMVVLAQGGTPSAVSGKRWAAGR